MTLACPLCSRVGTAMRPQWGFTFVELLFVVAIVLVLVATAIPGLMGAQRRSRYAKAATDTKTAVTQAAVYGSDRGAYPTILGALRVGGYANVSDFDPWSNAYQLSPPMTAGQQPGIADDLYVYSKGPGVTGTYPVPYTADTGQSGSVGYSSVYGAWTGR